ncbi:MAG: GntR family transcriptional regulator, partial [Sulfobacillus sp.]
EMEQRGLKAGSRVLSVTTRPCPPTLVTSLQLKHEDPVWVIERLRTAGDLPMGIQWAYLSYDRFPQLGTLIKDGISLYALLATTYRVYPEKAVETYSAVELSVTEAELLQRESTRPAFAVERLTSDTQGTVIEYVRSVMRNDKYHYTVELVRTK